ncbi:MAG TPA: hypothetical protein VJ521_07240, partial [Acidobacteriota bacterium]|nr:hypothetical protein [Acidobacteriota bacterium]
MAKLLCGLVASCNLRGSRLSSSVLPRKNLWKGIFDMRKFLSCAFIAILVLTAACKKAEEPKSASKEASQPS